ncbi:MAG: DUF3179 domain-containing protein [Chloroflexota bacterium]|nr:DUF3179 domain-containing protein [Chloroflexota bacterium]
MRKALVRHGTIAVAAVATILAFLWVFGYARNQAQDQAGCNPPHLRTVNWSTDFCNSIVDFDEILVGNPTKDGIPSLTDPNMEPVAEAAAWLSDRSPVIAVEIDGEARAYPQAILMWHEIANVEVAGIPIAVTFCPLCNSSISFDRRVDGKTLDFGVSGFLRNSDLIMYDRQSETWWQQLTGEGLVGGYAGLLLDIVPSQVISFASFAERHPEGLVLSRDTGFSRQYGINPYRDYDSRPGRPFLFRGEIDARLGSPVDHVLAATVDGIAKAYPFAILREQGVINDSIGEKPVVAFFQTGLASALGDSVIDNAADLGSAGLYLSTLDGQTLTFVMLEDGSFTDEQTGSTWNAYGEAIAGSLQGRELEWVHAFPHFWFAWAAFHPETEVYGI